MDENNSAAEARTAETRARVEHAAEVSENA